MKDKSYLKPLRMRADSSCRWSTCQTTATGCQSSPWRNSTVYLHSPATQHL